MKKLNMPSDKNNKEKSRLHPRNKNRERYDLDALIKIKPELKKYIIINKYDVETVNFAQPEAVKLLNQSILYHYYGIEHWDFPDENLCPPIPGRADYIHHIADLLGLDNDGEIPLGNTINCLDIGTGASCIYSIIGAVEYGWKFVGSEVDDQSVISAEKIVNNHPTLQALIEIRTQPNPKHILENIIILKERFDVIICNPPFHASAQEAQKGSARKVKNLTGKKIQNPQLNFAGIQNELIYEGGELGFIQQMIYESRNFWQQVNWFTTLVSKQSNVSKIHSLLKEIETTQIKEIPMGTSNKSSRIIAWTFLTKIEQMNWQQEKWDS